MITLEYITTYKDGGSRTYCDDAGRLYWENRKLSERDSDAYGKLFCGELGNKDLAYGVFITSKGDLFNQTTLIDTQLSKFLQETNRNEKGFILRYTAWKAEVQKWADKHKISLKSAYSILNEYNPENDLKTLISWEECGDFLYLLNKEI